MTMEGFVALRLVPQVKMVRKLLERRLRGLDPVLRSDAWNFSVWMIISYRVYECLDPAALQKAE